MLVSMNTETHAARILTRKVRKSGSEGLALLLMLSGIFLMLFTWWPIGFLCIIIAFFADARYGPVHYCPACGNDVAPTSRLCPTCSNALAAAKPSTGPSSKAVLIALLIIAVIATSFFPLDPLPSAKTARQTSEQREQIAREIAARSEYNDAKEKEEKQRKEVIERAVMEAKIKRALDMAKNGGTELPPLPPIVPPNQSGSLPPPGLLYR